MRGNNFDWGSCHGDSLDLVAPGVNIVTTDESCDSCGYHDSYEYTIPTPADDTAYFGGTSASAPIVAGVCGLILSMNNNLTPAQVRNTLILSADKVEWMGGANFHVEYGYGRVNAYKAVRNIYVPTVQPILDSGFSVIRNGQAIILEPHSGSHTIAAPTLLPANTTLEIHAGDTLLVRDSLSVDSTAAVWLYSDPGAPAVIRCEDSGVVIFHNPLALRGSGLLAAANFHWSDGFQVAGTDTLTFTGGGLLASLTDSSAIAIDGRLTFAGDTFTVAGTFRAITAGAQPSARLETHPGTVLTHLPQITGYQSSAFVSNCTPGEPCEWFFRDSVGLDVYGRIDARNTCFRGADVQGGSSHRLWDGILLAYPSSGILLDSCSITDILTDPMSLHGSALTLYAASDTANRIRNCRILRSMPVDSAYAGDGVLLLAYHGTGGKTDRSFLRMENCCVYEYWFTGIANAESDLHMDGCRVFANFQGLGSVNPAKSHLAQNCIIANRTRGVFIDNQATVYTVRESTPPYDGVNDISFNGPGGGSGYQVIEAQVVLEGTATLNAAPMTAANGNNTITHAVPTLTRIFADTSSVVYAQGNWWGVRPDNCTGTHGDLSQQQKDMLFAVCNPGLPFVVDSALCDSLDSGGCSGGCGDVPAPPRPVLIAGGEAQPPAIPPFRKSTATPVLTLRQALAQAAEWARRGAPASSYEPLGLILGSSGTAAVASIVAHALLHYELGHASVHPDSMNACMARLAGFLTNHIQSSTSSNSAAALREGLAHTFACAGDVPAAEQVAATVLAQHGGTAYASRILHLTQFLNMARWDTAGVDATIASMAGAGYSSSALRQARAFRAAFLRVEPRPALFPKLHLPTPEQQGEGTSSPERFFVHNHPNPFNPSTIITFGLPGREHVTLRVYSAMGNLVATLVDELRDAGEYRVIFDADRFIPNGGSGFYFCVLSTADATTRAGMLLLR